MECLNVRRSRFLQQNGMHSLQREKKFGINISATKLLINDLCKLVKTAHLEGSLPYQRNGFIYVLRVTDTALFKVNFPLIWERDGQNSATVKKRNKTPILAIFHD